MTINKSNSVALAPPIFVVGVDRSGTTLLNMMLDAHSELFITYEVRIILRFYEKLSEYGSLRELNNRKKLIIDLISEQETQTLFPNISLKSFDIEVCDSFAKIIEQLYASVLKEKNKSVWGDKDPNHTNSIEFLNELFPHCRFIHIVRDGRDVALSLVSKHWGPNNFINAIKYWERTAITTDRMLKMLPNERVFEVKYEDLVINSKDVLLKLCNFVDIEYQDDMLELYSLKAQSNEAVSERIQGIHSNLSSKPDKAQLYKWRESLSSVDKAIASEIAHKALSRFGYEISKKTHFLKPFRKFIMYLQEAYTSRVKH